jgi:hypothetical protein
VGSSPPQENPGLKQRKPDIQTGFAIRSPNTLPVLSQESDQMQVLGHRILSN